MRAERLTYKQKLILTAHDMDWHKYNLLEDNPHYSFIRVVSKSSGKVYKVDRYSGRKKGDGWL